MAGKANTNKQDTAVAENDKFAELLARFDQLDARCNALEAENKALKGNIESRKDSVVASVEASVQEQTPLYIDPAIPAPKGEQLTWIVEVEGCRPAYVTAEDEMVAKKLYDKFMGIVGTANNYSITELKEAAIEELQEQDKNFVLRPIHRDEHNQVVRESAIDGKFDVAS